MGLHACWTRLQPDGFLLTICAGSQPLRLKKNTVQVADLNDFFRRVALLRQAFFPFFWRAEITAARACGWRRIYPPRGAKGIRLRIPGIAPNRRKKSRLKRLFSAESTAWQRLAAAQCADEDVQRRGSHQLRQHLEYARIGCWIGSGRIGSSGNHGFSFTVSEFL